MTLKDRCIQVFLNWVQDLYIFVYKAARHCYTTPDYNPNVTVFAAAAMTHHSFSLPLPSLMLSLCKTFIPLYPLSPHTGLSLSSLSEPVWSLPVGVCVWVRTPYNLQDFVLKTSFVFFKRPAGSLHLSVCIFLFFIFSRWKQTECRHNKITAQKIRAARNQMYTKTFLHEIHPSLNYSNAQII